jgi:DNA-binding SARP family transcriptional activator
VSAVRRAIAGLGALVVLAALLVGVPVALAVVVGWPLPHSWPTVTEIHTLLETWGIPDIVLIDALAIVCWIAWIDFALATCLEALAAARGRAASRPLLARPWQAIAAHLVTTVVVAVVLLSSRPPSSQPARGAALSGALAARQPLAPADPVDSTRVTSAALPSTSAATSSPYVVRGGDTLWGISGQRLGDPRRWTDVWRRNRERAEPHGRRFTNPNLILPGWSLDVPPSPDAGPSATPAPTPLFPTASPPPPAAPTASPVAGSAAPPAEAPSRPPTTLQPRPALSPQPAHLRSPAQLSSPTVTLPSGSVVGLAFAAGIVAGLGAARLHERRRRRIGSGDRSAVDGLVGPTVRQLRAALNAARPPDDDVPKVQPTAGLDTVDIIDEWRPHPGPTPAGITQDGVSDDIIDVVDLTGRTLTGPGAEGAGRALVSAAVTGPALDTDLLLIGATERFLCGVGMIPGIEVIDTVPRAIAWLEAECGRRDRVLRAQGASDYRSITTSSDPLGTLLVMVHGPQIAHAADVKRLVDRGGRLGLSIVIVGSVAGFDPLEIAEDGSITNGAAAPSVPERLFSLSEAEAAELLAVARAGRGAPVETVVTTSVPVGLDRAALLIPEPTAAQPRSVQVLLFGPPRIVANGAEVATGLREAARELLFLLALRRQGLRQAEALAEIWPDEEEEHIGIFRVAITSTRRRLRELCGGGGQFIILTSNRYVLDPDTVDCDVWSFDAAVARASRESDLATRREAMAEAAELVTGEPLAGAAYEWAEPVRESLRRRAIDLLGELAALLAADEDFAGSVAALERARTVDPYCEDVYRRLMRHLADMGRDDVALRVYRELERYAAMLGTGPDADTEALMVGLRARSATRRNIPRAEEADEAADWDDEDDREARYGATAARMTIVGQRRPSRRQPGSLSSPADQPPLPILDDDSPNSM